MWEEIINKKDSRGKWIAPNPRIKKQSKGLFKYFNLCISVTSGGSSHPSCILCSVLYTWLCWFLFLFPSCSRKIYTVLNLNTDEIKQLDSTNFIYSLLRCSESSLFLHFSFITFLKFSRELLDSEFSTHNARKIKKQNLSKTMFGVAVVTPAVTDAGWHEIQAKEGKEGTWTYFRGRSKGLDRAKSIWKVDAFSCLCAQGKYWTTIIGNQSHT